MQCLVDAPLEVGRTWSTTFDVYSLPDLSYQDTWTIAFVVAESGIYEVPAGSFEGFGIGSAEPALFDRSGRQYTLTGELAGSGGRDADSWWSLGVGEIRYRYATDYQLESYQIGSVAVEARTLSAVKGLFD